MFKLGFAPALLDYIAQALLVLRREHGHFRKKFVTAAGIHFFLVSHDLRGRGQQIFVEYGRARIFFRFKANEGHAVFQRLGQGFGVLAGCAEIIQPGQGLICFNHFPFAHQHFAQDAAFEVLYNLRAAGGHHLPLSTRDFVNRSPPRPDKQSANQNRRADGKRNSPEFAFAQQGGIHLVHIGQMLLFVRRGQTKNAPPEIQKCTHIAPRMLSLREP